MLLSLSEEGQISFLADVFESVFNELLYLFRCLSNFAYELLIFGFLTYSSFSGESLNKEIFSLLKIDSLQKLAVSIGLRSRFSV